MAGQVSAVRPRQGSLPGGTSARPAGVGCTHSRIMAVTMADDLGVPRPREAEGS